MDLLFHFHRILAALYTVSWHFSVIVGKCFENQWFGRVGDDIYVYHLPSCNTIVCDSSKMDNRFFDITRPCSSNQKDVRLSDRYWLIQMEKNGINLTKEFRRGMFRFKQPASVSINVLNQEIIKTSYRSILIYYF